jgi:antirestriction protein ArdC
MNHFFLSLLNDVNHPMASELNAYATMLQINEHGGKVKKGSKALPVTFMKKSIYVNKNEDGTLNEDDENARVAWLIKTYNVFPIECVEGIDLAQFIDQSEYAHAELEDVKESLQNIFAAIELDLLNGNCVPHYAPSSDYIKMPKLEKFKTREEYYSTMFHELIHATGHKKRTGRFASYKNFDFDSNKHEYSFEELVAEMGAAILCSHFKIPSHKTLENSKAYIQSWSKVLKNDKNMAYMAASKAQQAVDYILTALEGSSAKPSNSEAA